MSSKFDVIIIGAGAAGLFCAMVAGQQGRRVLVLDHANKIGKKILMSGGGRCNFTNLYASPENYFSKNPHFFKSALSRYSPYEFLQMVDKHGIEHVEKEQGQLFCNGKASAKYILQMLVSECQSVAVDIRKRTDIYNINKNSCFKLETSAGEFEAESLVIATGGLSIPTLGATGFGYEVAKQFDLNVLKQSAALVPFTLTKKWLQKIDDLSGLSLDVIVNCNNKELQGAMLFTHRGLSGPVILQISSYWRPGDEIVINLFPDLDLYEHLAGMKQSHPKMEIKNILSESLPKKLAHRLCEVWGYEGVINQFSEKKLEYIAEQLQSWHIKPSGTEGYKTAEVTMGGVDTDELSSKTMESKKVPGLFFIGEVVDVTGQLGGYNFQWAWASAWAAGQVV
jgi:predicted Rossmann fold flavoprotein